MGDTDETCPVYAQYYRRNNCAEHSNQSSKLSVVRDLRWGSRRRSKLWLHNISTMPGHGGLGERLLPAEYAIRASTRAAFLEQGSKALFVLTVRLQQKLRQLGDIRRDPPCLVTRKHDSKYLVVVGRPNHTNN